MRWSYFCAVSLVLCDDHEGILNKRRIIYYLRSVVDTTSTVIFVFLAAIKIRYGFCALPM